MARIGGDEFVVILDGLTNEHYAATVARKVIQAVTRPIDCAEKPIHVGISIGISIYPQHTDDLEELVKYADQAMYQVKSSGKNNYAYINRDSVALTHK